MALEAPQNILKAYEAPPEVYEGRNWITPRLAVVKAFHVLDLIEDACSFEEGELIDQLRGRIREMFELACKVDVLITDAMAGLTLEERQQSDASFDQVKSCIQEIRDRGNLSGRESEANLQLRLQWVLSLISHLKYHLAGMD